MHATPEQQACDDAKRSTFRNVAFEKKRMIRKASEITAMFIETAERLKV
jgi:hypothetical protein